MKKRNVFIALPVLNESENLPVFLNCLRKQTFKDFTLVACVNNYEWWWGDTEKRKLCLDNQQSLDLLQDEKEINIHVIDCSSIGKGWSLKKGGVGMARKVALDFISGKAEEDALMVSMDADTDYPRDYLNSIISTFEEHPNYYGLSLPYYHPLTGKVDVDRLILRYEIYMRYYALNMIRISNPYRFTALGSAMAFPAWAYRKAGGLTPVKSGEDFYFLQKLVKVGGIGYTADTQAYPSARFSDRVLFGTGPALIKGSKDDWSSYPFYPSSFFDEVAETYGFFQSLYQNDVPTPMDEFLEIQFGEKNIWGPIRRNYKDRNNFTKACISKVDGLRILQYLRWRASQNKFDNKDVLLDYILKYASAMELPTALADFEHLGFDHLPITHLNDLRDFFFRWEMQLRSEKVS